VNRGIISSIRFQSPFVYYTSSSHLFLYDISTMQSFKINGHEQGTLTIWHDIDVDRQGILWMVNTRGVSKLPSLAFTNYSNQFFLDDEVSTILPLKSENTFLGHNIGFTLVDDDRKIIWNYPFESKTGFTRILDAQEDTKGNIYITSSELGLIKLNPVTKKIKYFNNIPSANCLIIRNDTIWVGTQSSVFTIVNDKVISVLNEGFTRRLAFDQDGKLLLLQQDRILGLDETNIEKKIGTKYNTYFGGVYKNRFLVATMGGLFYFMDGEYEEFKIDGKHFNQPVYTFEVDNDKDLWIGTSNGVYQVCDNEMINHFDATNGLVSNEINRAAFVFDSDAQLWIGSHKGLSIYNKHLDNPLKLAPEVTINSIGHADNYFSPKEDMEFNYEKRDLEFVFSAYSFYSETTINFQYQLVGLDKVWKSIGNYGIRSIKYDNLPPGEYKFKVRARESQHKWSEVSESAMVRINSPYYFSIWFILLCLSIAIFLVAFITTFFNQRNLAKKLDEKLQEKMKEVLESKSELSQQNEELKTLNIQLDSFAYSVSHDLRAPIASSLGLINLLKLDKQNRQKYFELIEKSMIRMDKFITDVLEVSRNSRTEVKVDTYNVIKQVSEIIENQKYREGAQNIEFHIKTKKETITTDKRRLGVILTNLISNAISYSDDSKQDKKVEISFYEKEGNTIIIIRDNGIGVEAQYLNSLFKIFYRASEKSSGSGLGLYITEQTVIKLEGSISVESEFGKWTKFKLVIP
jgi:signal transduction histidine kinase